MTKFVKNLYILNTLSYNERYRENAPLPKDYEPKFTYPVQEVQLYKLIQCILYQIELTPDQLEKDNKPELAESLRAAQKMEHRIAYEIISNMPVYQKAAWGLKV